MGLNRKDGAGALLAASDSVSGPAGLGRRAARRCAAGYETAVAGALGSAADAVAVDRRRRRGRARSATSRATTSAAPGCCSAAAPPAEPRLARACPADATYAVDVVECPDTLRPALTRLLFKVAVVDDLDAARALVADLPDLTAVTRDGDVLGAHFAAGGSSASRA